MLQQPGIGSINHPIRTFCVAKTTAVGCRLQLNLEILERHLQLAFALLPFEAQSPLKRQQLAHNDLIAESRMEGLPFV